MVVVWEDCDEAAPVALEAGWMLESAPTPVATGRVGMVEATSTEVGGAPSPVPGWPAETETARLAAARNCEMRIMTSTCVVVKAGRESCQEKRGQCLDGVSTFAKGLAPHKAWRWIGSRKVVWEGGRWKREKGLAESHEEKSGVVTADIKKCRVQCKACTGIDYVEGVQREYRCDLREVFGVAEGNERM